MAVANFVECAISDLKIKGGNVDADWPESQNDHKMIWVQAQLTLKAQP